MANNIGPQIGIEGEREFRNQIRQINAVLNTLKTEEDAVTAAYDKNDKSAEKLSKQNEILNKRIEEQRKLIEKLQEGVGKATRETGENSTITLRWQATVNKATAELNRMERELADNNAQLAKMESGVDDADKALDGMGDGAGGATASIDALATALGAEKILSGLQNLADLLWSCVEASAQFESAMAGVAKTTDLSDEELADMGNEIKTLSTQMPIAANELAGIVEAAGQLGIAKKDLVSFSTVMANLGVATNLSATDAATALARFANITGTSSKDYERLGSTIVALGNNFATTESEIVEMSTRLASAGSVVGLTEAGIMALSTAMSSVGIEAEAGGSAMAKLLKRFETLIATGDASLGKFASVAGMTAEEFADAWERDALKALAAFIDGLGKVDKNGGSAVATMSELGLTEVRLSNAILALAKSDGVLTKAIETSNTAWEENTALAKEAETRYGTTESKFKMLENSATNLKVAIGDALTPALASLSEMGAGILDGAAEFIAENPGIVQAIAALATALGVVAGALAVATVAVKVFNAALAALNAHPVIAIVTAVVALTTALVAFAKARDEESDIGKFRKSLKESKEALEELNEAYSATKENIENEKSQTEALIAELKNLNNTGKKTEAQKTRIKTIVDELNQTVPELALAYNEETGAVDGLSESIDTYIDNLYRQYQMEAAGEQIVELTKQRADAINTQTEAQEKLAAATDAYNQKLKEQEEWLAAGGEEGTGQRFDDIGLGQLAADVDFWTNRLEEASEPVASFNAQIDELKNGMEELTEADDSVPASIQNAVSALQTLQEEYNAAYDAAYESLSKQTGLFKSLNNEATISAEEMKANLDSQIQWMTSYAANLKALEGRQIEGIEVLTSALSDGSTESAAALAGLATATDEEIAEIIQKFQGVEESKGVLAGAIAEEKTDFEKRMGELTQAAEDGISEIGEMTPEARQAAINVVNGLISGVDMRSGALRTKMITLGRSMISWINYGTDSHSPSKEAIKASKNVMSGLMLGVQEDGAALDKIMEQVGEKLIASFTSTADQEKAKAALDAYQSYIEDFAAATQEELDKIDSAWEDTLKKQEEMAQKLADYGELMETRTIKWSDGTSTDYTILSDLDAQISKIEEYGAALDALDKRGISDSLMQEVVSMDVDDAIEYANQLLRMSDERWKQYNESWEEKQRIAKEIAEKFYAEELGALELQYDAKLASSLSNLKDTAFESGVETVAGLMKGMQSKEEELKKQAEAIANIVAGAMRQSLDIHSPSRVTEEIGELTADGFEVGFTKRMDEIDRMTQSSMPYQQERDAAVVNAIGTLANSAGSAQPAEITLTLPNGMELARWMISDIRSLDKSDPEIKNDF